MNKFSSTEFDPKKLSIVLLSITKKELRDMRRNHPDTYTSIRTALFSSLIEAKYVYQQTKLAINRLNSL